jgi:hypothetical protein
VVASKGGVRGVMVFGASARRWRDCIADSARRQLTLAGSSGDKLERRLALEAELHDMVCGQEISPAEVFRLRPRLRRLESAGYGGDYVFGLRASFLSALDRLDIAGAWRRLDDTDVLIMHGQYDWVCDFGDALSIVDAAGAKKAHRVRRVELRGIAHDFLKHADLQWSFTEPRGGRWDGRVLRTTLKWLRVRVACSPE